MSRKAISLILMVLALAPRLASAQQAVPIGWIDQVILEGGQFWIKGWSCQPNVNSSINVKVKLNNVQYGVSWPANQWSEPAIHQACGTPAGTGLGHRFSVPYPTNLPLSGQTVRVFGVGSSEGELIMSSQIKLPPSWNHPETVIAQASRIQLFVAHGDDEVVFSPMLAKYCGTKVCQVIVAVRDYFALGSPNDIFRKQQSANSGALIPAQFIHANLSSNYGVAGAAWESIGVQATLDRWTAEVNAAGIPSVAAGVQNYINSFAPDVVLTFDPRHGTSCHSEHRAVAKSVVTATQTLPNAMPDKSKVFLLTTVRTGDTPTQMGLGSLVPTDNKSVAYSANDFNSSKGKTNWEFLIDLLNVYSAPMPESPFTPLFSAQAIADAAAAHYLDRTTAFLRITDYVATDSRYIVPTIGSPVIGTCKD